MATTRALDPQRLDVAAFAAAAGALEGSWPLETLSRLGSAPDPAARVAWSVQGEIAPLAGAGRQPVLDLRAACTVTLQCQRCLEPLPLPLRVANRVFFVAGEDAAAALDADSDADILALEPRLDLKALIEDELLLALPLVPRHDRCPQPLLAPDEAAIPPAESEHPFAALAEWKRERPG